MNYYKLSSSLEDLKIQEAGPFVARVTDPGDTVLRRHSLYSAEMHIRAEWNRYIGTLIAKGAKSMFKNIINRLRISRTMFELNNLDDRMLADIGLTRSEITSVARRIANVSTQPVAARTIITPAATMTEIPAGFVTEAANTDEQREAA
ncbi:DUF1127 domain-containing protein [Nisaea nitritireducens]|uniref:DUF1127 domain-containing protein n=1 Tax=Nisaea nitritireducens TaxID=568392 RepID=UPI001D024881|nr:DUF1127 domain-containing protein [Nisaea nitritireducens]